MKLLFEIPDGLETANQLDDGEEMEVLAKVVKRGDKLSLIELEGFPLEVEEDDEPDDNGEDSDEDFDVAVMRRVSEIPV